MPSDIIPSSCCSLDMKEMLRFINFIFIVTTHPDMNFRLFNKHRYEQEIEKLSTSRELGTRKKEKFTNQDFAKFKKINLLIWVRNVDLKLLEIKAKRNIIS